VHLREDIHAFHFKIKKERTQGEKQKQQKWGGPSPTQSDHPSKAKVESSIHY
jgi:hypothetical protein